MSEHTEGRLVLSPYGGVMTETGERLLLSGIAFPPEEALDEAQANGRRLVALWNACLSISTEGLEQGVIGDLVHVIAILSAKSGAEIPAALKDYFDFIKAPVPTPERTP